MALLTLSLLPCGDEEGRAGAHGASIKGDGCDGCSWPCTLRWLRATFSSQLNCTSPMHLCSSASNAASHRTNVLKGERSQSFFKCLCIPPGLLCRLVSSGCASLSPGHHLALLMVPLCCSEHPSVSHGDALCELHHFFHRFLPWVCFLGSASVVIHPRAGSQAWSPSMCFAWLRTKTLPQLLTRLFWEGMGASPPCCCIPCCWMSGSGELLWTREM